VERPAASARSAPASARIAGAQVRPQAGPRGGQGAPVNAPTLRDRPADSVAGFLAALAIFLASIGMVYLPVRVLPGAILAALIAAAMGGRHQRLATFAVFFCVIAWIVGMTIAVATENPIY
jgi:hypothetical protein